MPVPFGQLHTPGGHLTGEVSSALTKSMRRGLEPQALYWAKELDVGGWPAYCWRRLAVFSSEDVGLASTETVLAVRALHSNWLDQQKSKSDPLVASLFIVEAVIRLCRAPKSRLIDDAYTCTYESGAPLEIPPWARDRHTAAGRRQGKGWADFYSEGVRVANPAAGVDNPYADEARAIRTDGEKK